MQPIKVDELKVAKTDALKQLDREEIKAIDGQIHGYNVRLQQVNAKAKKVLKEIESREKERSEVDRKIDNINEELEEKDSDQHVTAAEWSLSKEWKFLTPWQEEMVECTSPWPIATYTNWDNGHLDWKSLRVCGDNKTITGTVRGEFWRGLYANLTIKTCKRQKYADTIRNLRSKKEKAKGERDTITALLTTSREQEKECSKDIQLLEQYIKEKNLAKKRLSSNYMSLQEAEERLGSCTLGGTHTD